LGLEFQSEIEYLSECRKVCNSQQKLEHQVK
jgi:hypothetical protein